jgi:hypothetical protein
MYARAVPACTQITSPILGVPKIARELDDAGVVS